jgi:CRP-like cAMP-binding protein
MENGLINYFKKITALSQQEIDALNNSMVIKIYKKGNYLLKEGQYYKESFFVLNGLVRQYKLAEGEEITTNFYNKNQWILNLYDFEHDQPSLINLVCVEDTSVVVGDETKAEKLFAQFPRFEAVSRQVMQTVIAEQLLKLETYRTDKPEQRYLKLISHSPEIIQKVAQYDIASYLGIKPESLSRIRKKIALKNL